MRTINVTAGPYAAGNAALYVASAAPVSGTPMTLTGTKPDLPRRVLVSAGADAVSTRTFTLVGTNVSGNTITEVMTIPTGANAVVSTLDYATVTSATPTGSGWSANITVGTCTSGSNTPVASSAWVRMDTWAFAAPTLLSVVVTGTANFTVEESADDPNDATSGITPATMSWFAESNLTSQAASKQDSLAAIPAFVRLTLNSGTATTGSARLAVVQVSAPAV